MTDVTGYIEALIDREGGYCADPADRGGATCFGITEAVARAHGYDGPMEHLPRETAASIYLKTYWLAPHFLSVAAIDRILGLKLLDAGVNCGPTTAATWLQRALNVLNDGASRYPDLVVDGQLGAMSMQALRTFVALRGDEGREVLAFMLRSLQSVHYVMLAEARPPQERFEWGWQQTRAML